MSWFEKKMSQAAFSPKCMNEMGKPIIEMNNEMVESHFHLLEMKGFFSLTLRKMSLVRMWLKRMAILEHSTPKMMTKMISWLRPMSSN